MSIIGDQNVSTKQLAGLGETYIMDEDDETALQWCPMLKLTGD